MTARTHFYTTQLRWTGNRGSGTSGYAAYDRAHDVEVVGKPPLTLSSDPKFHGDATRHNPEELLVGALSSCHMLWYLHLASTHGLCVLSYEDSAVGEMAEDADGGGRFVGVTLRPRLGLAAGADTALALRLHPLAHEKCFIANSVNFPVACEPEVVAGGFAAGKVVHAGGR